MHTAAQTFILNLELSLALSLILSPFLPLPLDLSLFLPLSLSACLLALLTCLFVGLSICVFVCLFACVFCCFSCNSMGYWCRKKYCNQTQHSSGTRVIDLPPPTPHFNVERHSPKKKKKSIPIAIWTGKWARAPSTLKLGVEGAGLKWLQFIFLLLSTGHEAHFQIDVF